MFQLAKQVRYRRRRRLLRKLFWLQQLYSALIFVSLVVFLVETIVLNQDRLLLYHHQQSQLHLSSTGSYRRVILSCAALSVWACLYSVLMCYLIGYRASVASSVVHSALIGSYLVVWFGNRMNSVTVPNSLVSLSTLDCVLVLVQLSLGIAFVGMKRRLYRMIRDAIRHNTSFRLSTVDGWLPECPTAQFNAATEDIDQDNDDDQRKYQQDLDNYYRAENFERYSRHELERLDDIDRLCYLIP